MGPTVFKQHVKTSPTSGSCALCFLAGPALPGRSLASWLVLRFLVGPVFPGWSCAAAKPCKKQSKSIKNKLKKLFGIMRRGIRTIGDYMGTISSSFYGVDRIFLYVALCMQSLGLIAQIRLGFVPNSHSSIITHSNSLETI